MINLREIDSEIKKFESQPLSFSSIEKLALLYIVKDHNTTPPENPPVVIVEGIPCGDSEFMQACQTRSVADIMWILDEMMMTISQIHPKLYMTILKKLRE